MSFRRPTLNLPFALLAMALAPILPSGSATHTFPGDWSAANPNDPAFAGIWDEQDMIYAEAAQGGSAFLSVDDPDAGSVDHVAAPGGPGAGVQAVAAGMIAGKPTRTWDIPLGTPLAHDMFLNLSAPIKGRIYWSTTAFRAAEAANRGHDSQVVRVELWAGPRRIGGYEDVVNLAVQSAPTGKGGGGGTAYGAWMWISLNLWPEVAKLPEGSTFSLRITRSGEWTDFLLGTGGQHQSFLDVRYTKVDPIAGALYLQGHKIISYTGTETTNEAFLEEATLVAQSPAFEAAPPGIYELRLPDRRPHVSEPAFALAALPGLAVLHRRNARTSLIALVVAGAAFSGCLSEDGGKGQVAPSSGNRPDSAAEVVFEDPERPTGEGRGSLEGTVHSEVGLAIQGASVAIIGTSLGGATDKDGEFRFVNMTMGTYTLRVAANGYVPFEEEIEVKPAKATIVRIVLRPFNEEAARNRPHVHDVWQGQEKKTIQSFDVAVPACSTRDHNAYGDTGCETRLPIDFDQPVPPGTGRVEVNLTWSPGTTGPRELSVTVETAVSIHQWLASGGSGGSRVGRTYVARGPGDAFNVAVFPTEADAAHQHFTQWRFHVAPAVADLLAPSRLPTTGASVHVEMVAHKVALPFEPAHTDFWKGKDELVIFSDAPLGTGKADAATTAFPDSDYHLRVSGDRMIPPDTKEIRGYLRWSNSAGLDLTKWGVAFHPANQDPTSSVYPEAEMSGSGSNRTFTIHPTPGQNDQMYQTSSNWWFFVEDEDQPVNSSPETTWHLGVVAVRDPAAQDP